MLLFVNGTLMRGFELHANLRDSRFLYEAQSAAAYRLFSIDDMHPGMFRVESGGVSVAGEVYEVTDETFRHVVAAEPAGLYVDEVELWDGSIVPGVLCDQTCARRHRDISAHGGWREYLSSSQGHLP